MGVEQAVGAVIGAAGQVYGGYRANAEARKQASAVISDSELQAAQMEEENYKFGSEQQVAYSKSGVILDGSPLLVLEETRQKGLQDRLRLRERARGQAQTIAAAGRNQFIGSITGAGSKMFSSAGGMGGGGGGAPSGGEGYQGTTSPMANGGGFGQRGV